MDMLQAMEATRFLGEEFLTWLWFQMERQDGVFTLAGGERVEVFFEDQLTLEARLSEAELNRLSGGSPTESEEAKEALRRGKRVSKAKVKVVSAGKAWELTWTAQTLGIGGVKMPAVLGEQDDDRFYERMALVEELEGVLMGLYGLFLRVRLDAPSWAREVDAMRRWVAERTR
jgi:hypothetical protein